MLDLTVGLIVENGIKHKIIKLRTRMSKKMQLVRNLNGKEFFLAEVFEWDPDMNDAIERANKFIEDMHAKGYYARRFPLYSVDGVYICKK